LPLAISDTNYLHNVVGDTEIRKGEGMEIDQLIQNPDMREKKTAYIQPFDMETLGHAFQLRETAPVDLPSVGYPNRTFTYFSTFTPCFNTLAFTRLKKVLQLYRGNPRLSPETKSRSIKSTRRKTRTRNRRSTNIAIRIGVKIRKKIKTKTKKRRRIRVCIMIWELTIPKNIMRR
jgi:hypothetical protein